MKRQRRKEAPVAELPDDSYYAQQRLLVGPGPFIRSVLRRRESLQLCSTVAPEKQQGQIDVWGLCEEYEEDMFDSMDTDVNRNAAYARAFAAVPAAQVRWLEGSRAVRSEPPLLHVDDLEQVGGDGGQRVVGWPRPLRRRADHLQSPKQASARGGCLRAVSARRRGEGGGAWP